MNKCKEFPAFPTIRQEAKYGGTVTEYQLRMMLAKKELPGFYSGRTFKINHARLLEKLNAMSEAGMGMEATRQ